MNKNSCYECKHRQGNTGGGGHHSSCVNPSLTGSTPYDRIMIMGLGLSGIFPKGMDVNLHGVRNGWFIFPDNFDPIWLNECAGFESLKS